MESFVRGGGPGGRGAEPGALPLPPPPRMAAVSSSSSSSSAAAAASIRAHLARTGNGMDYQASPRSLLSRILLRGGDGGSGGGGFGCRVRLPRRYGSGGREERKDGGAEQGDTPRVKVVERPPPELPIETPRSSLGRRKPEEELVSMNLGLGASLVLLLSKSAVELNKMVELRAQMEALVSEIRQAAQRKMEEKHSVPAPASDSHQESNGSSATTTAVKDPIAFPATDVDAASNCSRTTDTALSGGGGGEGRAGVVIDRMEAELQAELNRLQRGAVHGEKQVAQGLELPLLKVKTKANVPDSPSRSCVDDGDELGGDAEDEEEEYEEGDEEEEEDDDEEEEECCEGKSPPHGGVSARALERRLHELLQKRQQERIVELESALDSARRRLHEKEREVVWWRDAAKLVSHRRDESHSHRIIVTSSSSGRDGANARARS